jgi:hypothetical protein
LVNEARAFFTTAENFTQLQGSETLFTACRFRSIDWPLCGGHPPRPADKGYLGEVIRKSAIDLAFFRRVF